MNQDEFLQLQLQQKSSGLTVKAYCQKHSISSSTFQYWKRKYDVSSPTPTKSSALIPMQIHQQTRVNPARSAGMIILLPNGVQLEFASSDDKVALQTLNVLCNRYV